MAKTARRFKPCWTSRKIFIVRSGIAGMNTGVELATARLRLCPCTTNDLDALLCLWTDPEVRRYLFDDRVISREEAETRLRSSLASFHTHGFGLWLAYRPGEAATVGFCGLSLPGDPLEV